MVSHVHDEVLSPVMTCQFGFCVEAAQKLMPQKLGGFINLHDSEADKAQIRAWNIVSIS